MGLERVDCEVYLILCCWLRYGHRALLTSEHNRSVDTGKPEGVKRWWSYRMNEYRTKMMLSTIWRRREGCEVGIVSGSCGESSLQVNYWLRVVVSNGIP